MLRIRRFEERCVELYSASRIRGFLHLYIGEEAVAVGVMQALEPADNIVATYREHGHALARGVPAASIMAEMFGRVEGCSRGRGGSMHLFDASRRFYGGNAIVGGGLPIAVGLALADQLLGRGAVTVVFFGEGAAAEGEFHECLNLAALWDLPVLFVCENNLYAMGTALARSQSETDLAMRAVDVRAAGLVGGRHGRAGGRAGCPAGRRGGARRRRARTSWSAGPTASGRTPCTTPTCTGTRPRSSTGRSAIRSCCWRRGCAAMARSTTMPSRPLEAEVVGRGRRRGGRR